MYDGYCNDSNDPNWAILGQNKNFALYGFIVAELVYNKINYQVAAKRTMRMKSRLKRTGTYIAILYITFISLSIGSNAIYNFVYDYFSGNSIPIIFLVFPFSFLIRMRPSKCILI